MVRFWKGGIVFWLNFVTSERANSLLRLSFSLFRWVSPSKVSFHSWTWFFECEILRIKEKMVIFSKQFCLPHFEKYLKGPSVIKRVTVIFSSYSLSFTFTRTLQIKLKNSLGVAKVMSNLFSIEKRIKSFSTLYEDHSKFHLTICNTILFKNEILVTWNC